MAFEAVTVETHEAAYRGPLSNINGPQSSNGSVPQSRAGGTTAGHPQRVRDTGGT